MSLETLKADLKANLAEAKKLSAMSTVGDVVDHMNNVLWPTMEAVVDELDEIDKVCEETFHGAPECLHPESGAVFAAVVTGAVTVSQALRARIGKDEAPELIKILDELERNCRAANDILDEIVIEDLDDDEDDDLDDDDLEDDDLEDDEDEDLDDDDDEEGAE